MSTTIISDSQKEFIVSSIKYDFRLDGRSNSEPQKYALEINNLDHLLGSCLLNLQSSQNEVHIYTGIKIKVQKQSAPTKGKDAQRSPRQIRDRVSLELACIKKLSEQQQQTRLYIQEYLNKFIVQNCLGQFESLLSIPSAKRHHLTINIETYILATPHISYLEYLFICIKNAIQNIQMPSFNVTYNQITDQENVDVTIGLKSTQNLPSNKSPYKGLETVKIVGVLGQTYVIGMTVEEYEAVESSLLIAFDEQKKARDIESLKGTLRVEQIHQIIKFAKG